MKEAHLLELIPDYVRVLVSNQRAIQYSRYLRKSYNRHTVRNWIKTKRFPSKHVIGKELTNNKEIRVGLPRSSKITTLREKYEINKNLGWLIGFWHAEGQKGKKKKYKITLSNSELNLIRKFLDIFQSQIGYYEKITIYIRTVERCRINKKIFSGYKNVKLIGEHRKYFSYKKPHYRIDIVNKIFYDLLNNLYEVAKDDRDFRRGYIAGFIDGDGYISKEGLLDIRFLRNEFSEPVYRYLKIILESEGFPVRDYSKKQFRLQVIRKQYSGQILSKFPLNHNLKKERLVPF